MDEMLSTSKIGKRHSITHLLMSERLTETGSPKIIIASMISVFLVILALILWSAITKIDEIVTGVGEIVPVGQMLPVQHLDGGIVYKVFVKDGQEVHKGDPLFELEPEPNTSDLKRLEERQNSLEISIYRIQSQLNGKPINVEDVFNAITYKNVTDPALLRLQINNAIMYQQQALEQDKYNKAQLASRLIQERNNLKNIQDQLLHLQQREAVIQDQVKMYNTLTSQQAISKVDLLNVQERLQEIIGNILTVTKERTTVESTILDLENKLKTFEFDRDNQALKELNDDTSQLLEVREQIARAKVAVDQLLVKSETDGLIKGLTLHPGDVVTAGTVLFEVVPTDSGLMAEIKISPSDVGQIALGDRVQVKVSTYDFATYGALNGKLSFISASTFIDADKKPYYKCDVTLDTDYLGGDPNKNKISPGMTVTADIKTGKRSLLKYMLKPINRTFGEAFREK